MRTVGATHTAAAIANLISGEENHEQHFVGQSVTSSNLACSKMDPPCLPFFSRTQSGGYMLQIRTLTATLTTGKVECETTRLGFRHGKGL
jgi:hypothetical protein